VAPPPVLCFKQTQAFSFKPAPGAWVVLVEEVGIGVEHYDSAGGITAAYSKPQPRIARGTSLPALARIAEPLSSRVAQLNGFDAVYVAGTHNECLRNSEPRPGLTCALLTRAAGWQSHISSRSGITASKSSSLRLGATWYFVSRSKQLFLRLIRLPLVN
jgi:hypothetical protein